MPGRLGSPPARRRWATSAGPNFPDDPTDLGPLVPLPGGWKELFEYFAKVGIEQVEFAGYGQNPANPGGSASYVRHPRGPRGLPGVRPVLRGFLDDNGLEAIGNHGFIPNTWYGPNSPGGTMTTADYDRLQTELEFASILGTPFMGTGSDPTNAQPQHRAVDDRGREVGALNLLSSSGASRCTPTTTTRPTTSSRTARW